MVADGDGLAVVLGEALGDAEAVEDAEALGDADGDAEEVGALGDTHWGRGFVITLRGSRTKATSVPLPWVTLTGPIWVAFVLAPVRFLAQEVGVRARLSDDRHPGLGRDPAVEVEPTGAV